MFAATRRASSRVSRLAAARAAAGLILEIDIRERLPGDRGAVVKEREVARLLANGNSTDARHHW